MGRKKRDYPEGTCRMLLPKAFNKDKEYPIVYEYNWNREIIRRRTGVSALESQWNKSTCELRSSFGRRCNEYNTLFKDNLTRWDLEMSKFLSSHPHQKLTSDNVRDILFDKPISRSDEGRDFTEYVLSDLRSRFLRKEIRQSRYSNGVSNMNGWVEFLRVKGKGTYKEDGIYLGEISAELVDEYIEYRKVVKGNSPATINHALTPIFKALEEAKDLGYISSAVYSTIIKRRLNEENEVSLEETAESFNGFYLKEEEMNKLVEFYENDTETRRKEYIEMFLFAFHSGGLRLVDVMTLRWCDIDFQKNELSKYLIKTRKKTKGRHIVPLTAPALAILNKWREKTGDHKFVFDLVKDDLNIDDGQAVYRARNTADKCVNQALKVVGEKVGLPISLRFHTSRHSFAMLALNAPAERRLSMHVVSRLLGHASTETTEKTYAKYLSETLRDEIEGLHFNFLPAQLKD